MTLTIIGHRVLPQRARAPLQRTHRLSFLARVVICCSAALLLTFFIISINQLSGLAPVWILCIADIVLDYLFFRSYGFFYMKMAKTPCVPEFLKETLRYFSKSVFVIVLKNIIIFLGSLGFISSSFLMTNGIGTLDTLASIIFSCPLIIFRFSALTSKTPYL